MATPLLLYPRTTDDPHTLRWVVGPGLVRITWDGNGDAAQTLRDAGALPTPIDELFASGELVYLSLQPGVITTRIADTTSWAAPHHLARRLRSILFATLSQPGGWPTGTLPAQNTTGSTDAELAAAVQELLDGPAGDVARSHGGNILLHSVNDGCVTLDMVGECEDCPAIPTTLEHEIARRLRSRFPHLREVRSLQ